MDKVLGENKVKDPEVRRQQRLFAKSSGATIFAKSDREESVYCLLVQYAEEGVIVSFMTVSLQPLIVHSFLQRLVRAS